MIAFTSVTKEFHGNAVLNGISFQIQPGEFVCLTGPSGAGKSTIVHLLICAEVPTSGTIEVDGADLAALPRPVLQMYRRKMGVLFQDYKLLADRTVSENIAFSLEVSGVPDDIIGPRVDELLRRLRLIARRDAFPAELSGGEKTRTALARALAGRPSILIADEPTGNIDPDQSMEILELLKEVNREGATVILASHDQRVIDSLNARVLRLENGKIVRDSVGGYSGAPSAAPVIDVVKKPALHAHHPHNPAHHSHASGHAHGTEHHHTAKKEHASPHEHHKPHSGGKIKPIGI